MVAHVRKDQCEKAVIGVSKGEEVVFTASPPEPAAFGQGERLVGGIQGLFRCPHLLFLRLDASERPHDPSGDAVPSAERGRTRAESTPPDAT